MKDTRISFGNLPIGISKRESIGAVVNNGVPVTKCEPANVGVPFQVYQFDERLGRRHSGAMAQHGHY